MGCDVGCPYIGGAFDDNWGLDDPTGKDDVAFIKVIREIEERIKGLTEKFNEQISFKNSISDKITEQALDPHRLYDADIFQYKYNK